MYSILSFFNKISILFYTTCIGFLTGGFLHYLFMTSIDLCFNRRNQNKLFWNNGSYLGIIFGVNRGLQNTGLIKLFF